MNTQGLYRTFQQSAVCFFIGMSLVAATLSANATTVQIQTVMGDIEINLFDKETPKTVANFLAYVNEGAYTNTIIHRSVPDFVVQGGGFTYEEEDELGVVIRKPAVVNEPVFSNVRGTIAMAKIAGNPHSATNQWFINLKNNSGSLDNDNGGYTVFGQVTGNGMAIIDAMAAVNRYNLGSRFGSAFTELPLRNYTSGAAADDDNFILITGITVLNASPDTADSLNPVRRIVANPPGKGGSSGGGSVSMLLLGILLMLYLLLTPLHQPRRR